MSQGDTVHPPLPEILFALAAVQNSKSSDLDNAFNEFHLPNRGLQLIYVPGSYCAAAA